VIIDAKCEACGCVVEDQLVKTEEQLPACPQCGSKLVRLWTLRKPKDGDVANHSSLRFHFNWMED